MPKIGQRVWPTDRDKLFDLGVERATEFCLANDLLVPHIVSIPQNVWNVDACAYYRANHRSSEANNVRVCITKCAHCSGPIRSRNWNWPATLTDREPYGVICHEIGHHADVTIGKRLKMVVSSYSSNYARTVQKLSGYEEPLTSYCPNPGEWFAEMFRLFITNGYLLARLRPKTFAQLRKYFKPISSPNWELELGSNVPPHIIENVRKKLP